MKAAAAWQFKPGLAADTVEWLRELTRENPQLTWVANSLGDVPTIELWHDHYWTAWRALRYDRTYIGQLAVEMPIFYSAIALYAERNGIEGEAFDLLLRFVSIIDFAYLDFREAERKEAMNQKNPPNPEAPSG